MIYNLIAGKHFTVINVLIIKLKRRRNKFVFSVVSELNISVNEFRVNRVSRVLTENSISNRETICAKLNLKKISKK